VTIDEFPRRAPKVPRRHQPHRGRSGGIKVTKNHVRIGALTSKAELTLDDIARPFRLSQQRLPHVAHPAIRKNRGTFGGSCALADPAGGAAGLCDRFSEDLVVAGKKKSARRYCRRGFFKGLYATAAQRRCELSSRGIPPQAVRLRPCA